MQDKHHQGAHHHQQGSQHVQLETSFLQGTEESGTDLHSECINEQDKSEVLQDNEHIRIYCQTEMSGQDASEEYEGRSKTDSENLDLSHCKSGSADQRKYEDSLCEIRCSYEFCKPIHVLIK